MRGLLALLLAALGASVGSAHEGHIHPAPAADLSPQAPLPFALGGPFLLIDQHGMPRSEADPEDRAQLLFFGYAACEQICSVALPVMADAVDKLTATGVRVTPVMITIDPETDTEDVMRKRLAEVHPDFIGLTGQPAALERAYSAFGIERKRLFADQSGNDVFAHGSFIYLLDAEGRFLTLIPPILTPERIAEIVSSHLGSGAGG